MEHVLLTVAYLVSSVCFILSLRGLSSQESAGRGNLFGIMGMAIALMATATVDGLSGFSYLFAALTLGAAIGAWLAARVAMTAMPELVAILHSFVGLAAVLVGFSIYLDADWASKHTTILLVEIGVDVAIGAITFTGSIVAFLKLKGHLFGRRISGNPLLLPGRHAINLILLTAAITSCVLYVHGFEEQGLLWLVIMATISGVLGVHLVLAIGGADMPVVVSMLNSYSGWTAAAAGFMLSNDLLIITGALVGSSGAILSYVMCRAMNRSILNVIFGGFGSDASRPTPTGDGSQTSNASVQETDIATLAGELAAAKRVVLVPGYGMAVARAQHTVRELTSQLQERGVEVKFAIHPVAGRLPGHMNVLLAEANVPYDIVFEMDELNEEFPEVCVTMVIGANDIVNPGAKTDVNSPIYGMPVLEVWNSRRTVMMKRGRAAGYAGVDNPLFYHERTRMLFGDARESVEALVQALRMG